GPAERRPGLLARHVDHCRTLEVRGGEYRQEDERVVTRVVRPMYEIRRNVRGVSRTEPTPLPLHPLLRRARDDIDDLLHRRVTMEGMPLPRWHPHPHEQQSFGLGDVRTGEPLVRPPG